MAKKNEMDFRQVFQGDVWLMRLPDDFVLKAKPEESIPEIQGRLRLLEGELTGHHHYIDVMVRPTIKKYSGMDDLAGMFADKNLGKKFKLKKKAVATFSQASNIANELVQKNILLRSDLVIGFLKIENGPMQVLHQEHNSIYLSPGRYIVGRQIESVSGEERRVAD
jgi:hypothetical protein